LTDDVVRKLELGETPIPNMQENIENGTFKLKTTAASSQMQTPLFD